MRWVAVWTPSADISEEEWDLYARPMIRVSSEQGLSKAELEFPDGRIVYLYRISFRLPIMVESPEEFAAFAFRDLIFDNAFDDESETLGDDAEEETDRSWRIDAPGGTITIEVEEGAPHPLSGGKELVN